MALSRPDDPAGPQSDHEDDLGDLVNIGPGELEQVVARQVRLYRLAAGMSISEMGAKVRRLIERQRQQHGLLQLRHRRWPGLRAPAGQNVVDEGIQPGTLFPLIRHLHGA